MNIQEIEIVYEKSERERDFYGFLVSKFDG